MRVLRSLMYLSLYLCSFVFMRRPVFGSYMGSGLGERMSGSALSQSYMAMRF